MFHYFFLFFLSFSFLYYTEPDYKEYLQDIDGVLAWWWWFGLVWFGLVWFGFIVEQK